MDGAAAMKKKRVSLRGMVDSVVFESVILAAILVNTIALGFETSLSMMARHGRALHIIDRVCLCVFMVELLLRFAAYNKDFFRSGWNVFDLVVIALSLVPEFPTFTVFRILRAFRIARTARAIRIIKAFKGARALRLVSSVKRLRTIFRAIVLSIPGIAWTVTLLLLFFYIYAIIGVELFRDILPDKFGALGEAMFTLFQVMTFESWSEMVARPIMKVYSPAWLYFISFVVITAFTIMNVVVGIVVDSIYTVSREDGKKAEGDGNNDIVAEIAKLEEQLARVKELAQIGVQSSRTME